MSDPKSPRPVSPTDAAPPPEAAPSGTDARRQVLIGHFRQHSNRFTRYALEQAARAAGYSDNDMAAAWSAIDFDEAGVMPAGRYATWARLVVLALYLGTFLFFVIATDMPQQTYGIGTSIFALVLLIAGGISMLMIGRRKVVTRNRLLALAGLLAAPFVLLVIVAGLCVATTAPRLAGTALL